MYKIDVSILCIIVVQSVLLVLLVGAGDITISGISSGGYMAVQFHVAFSSIVSGVGVIAGGPYYCAKGNVVDATTECMSTPSLISIDELIAATSYAEDTYTIDPTSNMANSKVWLFSGTKDTVVQQGVVKKLEEYYTNYIDSSRINTTYDIPAEHSFVTDNFGNACDYLGPDYMNNCGFNSAYNILSYLIGPLNTPSSQSPIDNILQIDQASFIPIMTPLEAGLYEYAYAYIPSNCQYEKNKGVCSVHVAYHGCVQTIPDINSTFYMNAGYNEIADSNNLIVLYPQAQANELNPKGCFDWWGYSGEDYASQLGVQMVTVKKMVDYLISEYISSTN
ncbi:polyhydroxybutyrate depolymerase [Cavenderia fasciculata]|uniref:Polyhydroxybutyrate depolymerase n=1 Tax=Cavenderia fasciculata TaxID=261658 RepID=F4PMJ9_CACFS|nr:polyhydroxybutyrate depolymerase [Cavenderia fasciculata]EGG23646.1 polyhydroxybutyrate depolymerase [Cavenderia fasciculata]|eukprot:XP_004361497.1 polyhydroxybutyrate depolymerase [Cavenderia fasciculata]